MAYLAANAIQWLF